MATKWTTGWRILISRAVVLCLSFSPSAHGQNCLGSSVVSVQLRGRINGHAIAKDFPVPKVGNAVLFQAGMEIDVDGAPNAYGPGNTGLDYTANAKNGNAWAGVVTDATGIPARQQSGRYKGYYVSTTSLRARDGRADDPNTYVDATQVPYIALPPALVKQFGVMLGDSALVVNRTNGKSAYAIYADVGPSSKIGEGSLALARALGFSDREVDPRHGGVSEGIQYLIFPRSGLGQGRIPTPAEIDHVSGPKYEK